MSKIIKSSRRDKIAESLRNLPIVSEKVRVAEESIKLAKLFAAQVEDPKVSAFILASADRDSDSILRGQADMLFLRKQIFYHASKLAESMSVDDFKVFGDSLLDLI